MGKLKHTTLKLQLAERSYTYHRGELEYVLVKVTKFIFPVDFVFLDMEGDNDVPIIIGRLFLAIV